MSDTLQSVLEDLAKQPRITLMVGGGGPEWKPIGLLRAMSPEYLAQPVYMEGSQIHRVVDGKCILDPPPLYWVSGGVAD
jgi:hypothetical protein